jgi:hypothetical protein
LKEKKFWFRILNEATNINPFRFLYEATGISAFLFFYFSENISYGEKRYSTPEKRYFVFGMGLFYFSFHIIFCLLSLVKTF